MAGQGLQSRPKSTGKTVIKLEKTVKHELVPKLLSLSLSHTHTE